MGVSLSYKLKGPWRWLSGPLRVLPDFLIPGVQKSGTTSLYNYLVQHPAVAQPCIKEIHYFDKKYRYGVRWYRGRFPTRHYMEALSRQAGERAITGEASTHYLFHPLAAERIAPLLPEAKTIVVLRNPVERAYSHYQHQVRAGRETLTFEQAIERELDWMAAGQGKMLRRDGRFVETYRQFSYLSRGLYAEQLQRWWRHLPKERSLIYQSEAFFADPKKVYQEVVTFLGLSPWCPDNFKPFNAHPYTDINPQTRQQLADFFKPHNEQLYQLIGEDYGWQ